MSSSPKEECTTVDATTTTPLRPQTTNNYSWDDLSSLSTIISRDLAEEISVEEGLLLRKLEKQNKRKFQQKRFRFNIVFVGEQDAGKSLLRDKMMWDWVLLSSKVLPLGTEYCYQLNEKSSWFQVCILEAKPSNTLVAHIQAKVDEYICNVKSLHSKRDELTDERVHLCVWVFPANETYWRLQANRKEYGNDFMKYKFGSRERISAVTIKETESTSVTTEAERPCERTGEMSGSEVTAMEDYLRNSTAESAKELQSNPQNGSSSSSSPPLAVISSEPLDLMKQMVKLVSLVPVITKADCGLEIIKELRDDFRNLLKLHKIRLFNGWLPDADENLSRRGAKVNEPIPEEVEFTSHIAPYRLVRSTHKDTEKDEEGDYAKKEDTSHSDVGDATLVIVPDDDEEEYRIRAKKEDTEKKLLSSKAKEDASKANYLDEGDQDNKENPELTLRRNFSSRSFNSEGKEGKRDIVYGLNDLNPYIHNLVIERESIKNGSVGSTPTSSNTAPFYEPLCSTFIQQMRSQVLTCPLIVDCVHTFDEQDVKYGLPRFDGFPPTSPDFLRILLIEGCSLLIIDRTMNLFTSYYERREREMRRREKFEAAHGLIMSGLMVAAASAAFFLNRK